MNVNLTIKMDILEKNNETISLMKQNGVGIKIYGEV